MFSILLWGAQALPSAVRKFDWTITELMDAPDGFPRKVLGINGQPGYNTKIEVTEGDVVEIVARNNLTVPTALHWHGLHQKGTMESDGPVGVTQCPIPPGQEFVYRFHAEHPGSYWWHGHQGAQYVDGLRGPFIVKAKQDVYQKDYDEEMIVQLGDWYHRPAEELARKFLDPTSELDGNEPVWSSGLINGRGTYNCSAPGADQPCQAPALSQFSFVPGKRYRLRIINMSAFAAYNFTIQGHGMRIIETDNVPSNGQLTVTSMVINVAQRYSVIVQADQAPGQYVMRADLLQNNPWTTLPENLMDKGLIPFVTAQVVYSGSSYTRPTIYSPKHLDEFSIQPLLPLPIPNPTKRFNFEFSIHNTQFDPVNKAYVTLDGGKTSHSYTPPNVPILFDVGLNKKNASTLAANLNAVDISSGDIVEVVILNHDAGEHPIHLHGHDFWIMDQGTSATVNDVPSTFSVNNPSQRDTTTIQACPTDANGDCTGIGWTVLRFVADNPGVWTLHCHIDWHLLTGLAMTFIEDAPRLHNFSFRKDAVDLCRSNNVLRK